MAFENTKKVKLWQIIHREDKYFWYRLKRLLTYGNEENYCCGQY